jgi:hypothetical protein
MMRALAAIFAAVHFIGASILSGLDLVQNAIVVMLGAIFWMLVYLGEVIEC